MSRTQLGRLESEDSGWRVPDMSHAEENNLLGVRYLRRGANVEFQDVRFNPVGLYHVLLGKVSQTILIHDVLSI